MTQLCDRPPRPTWTETAFALAQTWALRGTCPRLQAGVVFMDRKWHPIAAGYNGAVRKQEHCTEVGCLMVAGHCTRALHAEQNGIIQAARQGTSIVDSLVFLTARPCQVCAKMLIQVGVAGIHYWAPYNTDQVDTYVEELFKKADVPLRGPYACATH